MNDLAIAKAMLDACLAEWLAINAGKTKLEYRKYIEEARDLADYLTVLGYVWKEKGTRRCHHEYDMHEYDW